MSTLYEAWEDLKFKNTTGRSIASLQEEFENTDLFKKMIKITFKLFGANDKIHQLAHGDIAIDYASFIELLDFFQFFYAHLKQDKVNPSDKDFIFLKLISPVGNVMSSYFVQRPILTRPNTVEWDIPSIRETVAIFLYRMGRRINKHKKELLRNTPDAQMRDFIKFIADTFSNIDHLRMFYRHAEFHRGVILSLFAGLGSGLQGHGMIHGLSSLKHGVHKIMGSQGIDASADVVDTMKSATEPVHSSLAERHQPFLAADSDRGYSFSVLSQTMELIRFLEFAVQLDRVRMPFVHLNSELLSFVKRVSAEVLVQQVDLSDLRNIDMLSPELAHKSREILELIHRALSDISLRMEPCLADFAEASVLKAMMEESFRKQDNETVLLLELLSDLLRVSKPFPVISGFFGDAIEMHQSLKARDAGYRAYVERVEMLFFSVDLPLSCRGVSRDPRYYAPAEEASLAEGPDCFPDHFADEILPPARERAYAFLGEYGPAGFHAVSKAHDAAVREADVEARHARPAATFRDAFEHERIIQERARAIDELRRQPGTGGPAIEGGAEFHSGAPS